MLFWLFIIVLVIGIAMLMINSWFSIDSDCMSFVGGMLVVAATVAIIISLLTFIFDYGTVDSFIAEANVRREGLVWQLENDIYDNDNDLGKRELIVDIMNWNEDLASKKANQKNFWVGIYYPNIFDQFEFIKLEGGN